MEKHKEEFKKHIEQIIELDELQFFCEECLLKMGQPKPKPFFEDTGFCNSCNLKREVSNPHFNFWFNKRGLTLEQNNGAELRKLIPFYLSKIPVTYNSKKNKETPFEKKENMTPKLGIIGYVGISIFLIICMGYFIYLWFIKDYPDGFDYTNLNNYQPLIGIVLGAIMFRFYIAIINKN